MRISDISLKIKYLSVSTLVVTATVARTHPQQQIDTLARAIKEFGFNNPILVDKNQKIIAGHARMLAAKKIGLQAVPTISLEHLSPEQVKAYRLADNRIAELAEWDEEALKLEFQSLLDLDFDLSLTGFDIPYIDLVLNNEVVTDEEPSEIADMDLPQVSQEGDLWVLGRHRILCGDSLKQESYQRLLEEDKADLVFTDPPYNVRINGHVLTKGKHSEFKMASGEMDKRAFRKFLKTAISNMVTFSEEGSIHYICMDWRHIYDLLHVGGSEYTDLKNICVWNKTNGGMGSLYRSKHEMVAVFKKGTVAHVNNVALGKHGRYRTNVWDYAGQNTFHGQRDEELFMHPTVKPVQMVADALMDCSKQNGKILDPFGGSGSTLIAAENTQRSAYLIELNGLYVDVAIKRWQQLTGKDAVLYTGETFAEIAAQRKEVCFV